MTANNHASSVIAASRSPVWRRDRPEVVNGKMGCTSFSDSWSFAILLWQTLTLNHPFVGDLVCEGEPELEEKAFAGVLPWIQEAKDDSNICTRGIPSCHVISKSMKVLVHKTFEEGKLDRLKRPSISTWVDVLHSAADLTIECEDCKGTYFASEPECPWCGQQKRTGSFISMQRWNPSGDVIKRTFSGIVKPERIPLTTEDLILTRRMTQGLSGIASREPHLNIKMIDKQKVSVSSLSDIPAWVAPIPTANEDHHLISNEESIVPSSGWMIFSENPNLPQRIILIGSI